MNPRKPEEWEVYSFGMIAAALERYLQEAANQPDPSEAVQTLMKAKKQAGLFQTKFEKMTK